MNRFFRSEPKAQPPKQSPYNNNNNPNNLLSLLPPPPTVLLRKPPPDPPLHHIYLTEEGVPTEIKKIVLQVENQMAKGEIVEATELLRKGKEIAKYSKDKLYNNVILVNLAICYYKIGLLEECFQELSRAESGLKQFSNSRKVMPPANLNGSHNEYYTSLYNRLKLKRIRGKIALQVCILFSEMSKHDLAMKYAKIGCRIHFHMIYDTLILCNGLIIKYLYESKYFPHPSDTGASFKDKGDPSDLDQYQTEARVYIQLPDIFRRLVNIISILNHVIQLTSDLRTQLLSRPKQAILMYQKQIIQSYGKLKLQVNLDDFMMEMTGCEWVYKNKILNQVQMENVKREEYLETFSVEVANNDILELITYLAVSFYCLSTEARFMQKNVTKQTAALKNAEESVLDSEHWLSKSLELAYSILPPEAPILSQIYSVHNKFHGIDKQPIPEDKEMEGCIKILKPLRRPKSTYNAKTSLCAPILIRIQTPKTLNLEEDRQRDHRVSSEKKPFRGNNVTIELGDTLKHQRVISLKSTGPKKLEFLNSLEKIYKNQASRTQHPLRAETNSLEKRRSNDPVRENSFNETRRPHSNGNTFSFKSIRLKSMPHLEHFKVKKQQTRQSLHQQSETIDIMQGLEDIKQMKSRKGSLRKNVDIQINNNINLFITNQIGKSRPEEQASLTIQYGRNNVSSVKSGLREEKLPSGGGHRKVVLKLMPGSSKEISKRSIFYGKKKLPMPFNQESMLPDF